MAAKKKAKKKSAKKKSAKGHIPLKVLQKRLVRLNNIVYARSSPAERKAAREAK